MPKTPFSSRLRRSATTSLLLPWAALLVLAACHAEPKAPKLDADEKQLVAELVDLHRLQILQDTNPAQADSLRTALQISLDGPSLEQRIRDLGKDPERGAVLLRAVRDSLAAHRRELFGGRDLPEPEEGPARAATPRGEPADGGD